ncbi:3-hydroxyacyl-CoA dehydrogenase [Mesorhizobium sp. CGMCC 1.15528]|uniref:3-hydroxyacyl-CoA dehydrogenase n=1 Tax=Mesorhizobium zhangyense TaxID=1776730 RepID=A0A7C9VC68_9HYPH|nr:3-hydroxyacyl-CoA dehydrogenase NAD-binding domain-containing protein [Mesorhizobium zhangyense]NGN41470.1 3-hydroxyacyl-CoA dehydrogenase [Mesorhizobium zhangyense]
MSTAPIAYRSEEIRTVAIIGCGLIGGAWAAYFLSRGLAVRAYDPLPDGEARLRKIVREALADLELLGGGSKVGAGALAYFPTLGEAVAGADYVQENAPEKIELKQALLGEIDAVAPSDVVIGSSTSSFPASELQASCSHPQRIVVAHPFNPPHLVPLVEIVRGECTDIAAQDAAYRFFERIGKAPVRVTKEAVGHLANRMSAALWREAVHIVAEGIASVEDVDRAIRFGPGLRWAIDGPHMLYHLGGGDGGIEAYLNHLGPAQEARWATLGTPRLDAATRAKLIEGVADEADGRSIDKLKSRRDRLMIAVLKALADDSREDG